MNNIHPFVVHFPVALLTLYVFFEILPLSNWYPRVSWEDIKAILVSFGGLGILAALVTGQLAERSLLARSAGNILYLHKLFAAASAAVFGIVALAYVIRWVFSKHADSLRRIKDRLFFLDAFSSFILERWVVVSLALIGFAVLFITGALGEIIVYGPNNDVITQFVSSLLHLRFMNHP